MERHLLVTISEQKKAWYGVRFVENFFTDKDMLKVTLLYIVPLAPAGGGGELNYKAKREDQQLAHQYEVKGRKALEEARRQLVQAGIRDENVETKMHTRKFSKVIDIIQEGTVGLYDAVVLGHRALAWIEEAFDESISKQILQEKFDFPVWICRKSDEDRKNVLVAVDGSDKAYRIADHVGYILSQEKGHRVTLVLVNKAGAIASEDPAAIVAEAKKHLMNNGFPADMINTKILDEVSVRKAIVREAEHGRFAAVAVGQTGAGQGFLEKVFTGSLCNELVKGLEKTALWVCN
jgi:nucleotide-binding universal stress UspA family protein